MEAAFIKALNLSISAGWLVLAVILLRLLLKKAPKTVSVILWALVAFRLVCPFSFESVLSLIPSAETVPEEILYSDAPAIQSGIPALNSAVNPVISENFSPGVAESVNPLQIITFAAAAVWLAGAALMLIYAAVSCLKIKKKIREAVLLRDNIWLCDRISTPFIFGLVRPRIYLPPTVRKEDAEYVTAHENAHLQRRDYLIKPFGFLLLAVYWFNPLIWAAYMLMCRDIELACDERVIKNMGAEEKKGYLSALVNCSAPRRTVSACPLAFGETGVKGRIKSALNDKKPALWIILLAAAVCAVTAVCFLSDPLSADFDIEDRSWNFTIIQSQENGEVIYCSENEKEFYPNAEVISLSLSTEDDKRLAVLALSGSSRRKTVIEYSINRRTRGGNIYDLTRDDGASGYASVGKTEYYGGESEYILIITIGGYSIYFDEAKRAEVNGISATSAAAECENVEYKFLHGSLNKDFPYITVSWTNKTDDVLCFGEEFVLYKDGQICELRENTGWNLVLHIVASGESEEERYGLSVYDISGEGKYRLEKEFYLKGNPDKKYTAYIEFTVEQTYSFLGARYLGEKIVYDNGSYSAVLYTDETIPQFLISDADFSLLTNDYPDGSISSDFYRIGELKKLTLEKSNFDDILTGDIWRDGYSAEDLRKNNLNAFYASDQSGRAYYLLEQQNGEIYIAQGYTDGDTVRWIFNMTEAP